MDHTAPTGGQHAVHAAYMCCILQYRFPSLVFFLPFSHRYPRLEEKTAVSVKSADCTITPLSVTAPTSAPPEAAELICD